MTSTRCWGAGRELMARLRDRVSELFQRFLIDLPQNFIIHCNQKVYILLLANCSISRAQLQFVDFPSRSHLPHQVSSKRVAIPAQQVESSLDGEERTEKQWTFELTSSAGRLRLSNVNWSEVLGQRFSQHLQSVTVFLLEVNWVSMKKLFSVRHLERTLRAFRRIYYY